VELELLLERLELDGIEGIEGVEDDDEALGIDGIEEEDEEEELGIDGDDDDGDEDEDELGMDGMPLLLLELCWVDSQPVRLRASTDAPASIRARAEKRKNGVFMVASSV
jgi:hypothetical protein